MKETQKEMLTSINEMKSEAHEDRGKTNRLLLIMLGLLGLFFLAYLLDPQGEKGILTGLFSAFQIGAS